MATFTTVDKLPTCDFKCTNPANYDFLTKTGSWANGCTAHWRQNRAHKDLGTGKGQELRLRGQEHVVPGERSIAKKAPKAQATNSAPEPRTEQALQLVDTREAWLRRAVGPL